MKRSFEAIIIINSKVVNIKELELKRLTQFIVFSILFRGLLLYSSALLL